jgi:hypothetical protein
MPNTSVISSRLEPQQEHRLSRMARRMGRTPSETGALLIEEGLRRAEFAFIDFRDSPVGRQAYIQGSTLAVWEVVWIGRSHQDDAAKTAAHLAMPAPKVKAAFNYATAFPREIDEAIRENEESDFDALSRLLPQTEVFPPAKSRR